jgi:hypothetical protein
MTPTFFELDPDQQRADLRRRLVAILLTFLIEALLLWGILNIQGKPSQPGTGSNTKIININGLDDKPVAKKQAAKAEPVRPVVQPVITPPVVVKKPPVRGFVPMSREDFAAADISKLGAAHPSDAAGAGDAVVDGSGSGPGGATLYRAQWHREPGDRALAPYLKRQVNSGWGVIICQTIEHYRVENCQTRGESPLGSGLAQAMRRAAWQFEVVPPRINGRALIGAWVSIRFDLTVTRESAPASVAQDGPEEDAQ